MRRNLVNSVLSQVSGLLTVSHDVDLPLAMQIPTLAKVAGTITIAKGQSQERLSDVTKLMTYNILWVTNMHLVGVQPEMVAKNIQPSHS